MRLILMGLFILFVAPSYGKLIEGPVDIFKDLPKPGTGVTIVPASKAVCPNDEYFHGNNHDYKLSHSTYPLELLKLADEKAFHEAYLKSDFYMTNSDPHDTHLKKNLSQIRLAFPFKKLKAVKNKELLGFAAGGSWLKPAGWSDIVEYFKREDLGVCNFVQHSMKLTRGAIWLKENVVTYDVNGLVTWYFVKGSEETGFLYTLKWYDDEFSYSLECARKDFLPEQRAVMVEFGKKIHRES